MKPINMQKLVAMEKLNREIGKLIAGAIEQSGGDYGFALLMFSYHDGSEMTWISNAERADMLHALKELISKWETDSQDELGKAKRWNATEN